MRRTWLRLFILVGVLALVPLSLGCSTTATGGHHSSAIDPQTGQECGPEGCPIPGADGKVAPPPSHRSPVPPPATQPGK